MRSFIRRRRIPILIIWFALAALACNLGTTSRPPTLVPRATQTPPPTLGFATLSPEELPAVGTPPPAPDAALVNLLNEVESDRLFLHIDRLQSFQTRHVNSPYNLPNRGIGAAMNYITGQFEEIQARSQGNVFVFPQDFALNWAGVETRPRNIVAVLTGTEVGAGTILVGAHYDSTSENSEDGAAFAPGANDNGSGVAALIELARIMSTRPHRSTIMFVAFSAEEVGRVGSRSFLRDYVLPREIEISAMISLDIIGSQTGPGGAVNDRQMHVFSTGPNESVSRQLARGLHLIAVNHFPNMELVLQDAGDREGRYSDHLSFSEGGYPAVRLIEAAEEPGKTNTSRDTIDDIQASYLTRSTQSVLASLAALADGPRAPRNVSLRDEGNGLKTLVWEPTAGAVSYVVALRRPNSLIYDQQFETSENSVRWDGFVPERFAALAIVARDANGLLGPVSAEFAIR